MVCKTFVNEICGWIFFFFFFFECLVGKRKYSIKLETLIMKIVSMSVQKNV